jgi:hypothetical protein
LAVQTTPQSKSNPAYSLTGIIAVLAALVSAGGLFIPGLYRDNAFVTASWFGNDLVTLLVIVPALVASLLLARRGSLPAQLVWLGLLDCTLYNFAFYLFGTAFNSFFLLYVALFTLSIFALVFGLISLDVQAVATSFSSTAPVRGIGGFMLFVAAGLSTVYLSQSLGFIVSGEVPAVVARTGHVTNVVFALDLSTVIPILVLGAIWLFQRRPWGYVLAALINVKGAAYMLALSATTVSVFAFGESQDLGELPIWLTIGLGCLAASWFLLRAMRPSRSSA